MGANTGHHAGCCGISRAANFTNLGFDEAKIPAEPVNFVDAASALPGWTLFFAGTNRLNVLNYDLFVGDFPFGGIATLVSSDFSFSLPVFGKYSLILTPAIAGEMTLEQRGVVPEDARSIRFAAFGEAPFGSGSLPAGFFDVYFGDQKLDLSWTQASVQPWLAASQHLVWDVAGDVSAFVGKEVDLLIRTHATTIFPFGRPLHDYGVDNIEFSPLPIPEPNSIVLILLAGAAWVLGRF